MVPRRTGVTFYKNSVTLTGTINALLFVDACRCSELTLLAFIHSAIWSVTGDPNTSKYAVIRKKR